jgi:predicted AlkP superfamily pyrophosphatase or phosphodiesterase
MSKRTLRGLSVFWVVLTLVLAIAAGLAGARWMHERAAQAIARNTVVWLSIDGLRGDYVRRGELPFFALLQREAATTEQLRPAFPSTTFPSHSSEATGVSAERHGITGNSFYDTGKRMNYHFPDDSALLQSEPIWLTAQRQGVPTAVFDWPLSFAQKGPVRTEIYLEAYDASVSDEKKLARILDGWSGSLGRPNPAPLHLVMGYVVATDKTGHLFGPDAPQIRQEMSVLDGQLAYFSNRVGEIWKRQRHSPKDRLFIIFSTDHGMSPVRFIVNAERLLGIDRHDPDFHVTTTGNVGHVFLDPVKFPPATELRTAKLREFRERVAGAGPDFRAFPRDELPKSWSYAHPTRTGDLVILLPRGYTFGVPKTSEIVVDATSDPSYPKGMHGYDAATDPEMLGFLAIWEPGKPAPIDLGSVNWDQLHPTVAMLLGIRSAPAAAGTPLPVGGIAK